MTPQELVKQIGITEARKFSTSLQDLMQSFDRVEKCGGLEKSKKLALTEYDYVQYGDNNGRIVNVRTADLKKSIQDVEDCQ